MTIISLQPSPEPAARRFPRRQGAGLLLLLAATGVAVAGCGGSSGSSSSGSSGGSSAPAPAASSPAGSPAGTVVTADETEFKISLSQTSFSPGTYTFQTKNDGKFPHALTVDGPGVSDQATSTLQSGQNGSVTVTLQNGTYTIYCPVDGHRAKGMSMTITVGGGGGASSSPSATTGSGSGGGGGY